MRLGQVLAAAAWLVRSSVAVLTHCVRQAQARDRLAADDVAFDDLVDVGFGDAAVPDRVGIDDDGRAVLALIEAAGSLARTRRFSPRSASAFLNAFCSQSSASGSQQPRGCPGSRWLQQMKMCLSNGAMGGQCARTSASSSSVRAGPASRPTFRGPARAASRNSATTSAFGKLGGQRLRRLVERLGRPAPSAIPR